MTSKLHVLRGQLANLRRARQSVRWLTAFSAVATALLLTLGALFVIDVVFERLALSLSVGQRLVAFALASGAVAGAFYLFAWPYLGVRETIEDIALWVERRQGIESDLIAALQFESPRASEWGSPQLEGAVVDYVSDLGRGMNVFEGFSRARLWGRLAVFTLTALAGLAAALALPDHARVFADRLLLGSRHYPTRVVIDRLLVNDRPVLAGPTFGGVPAEIKTPEGEPLTFLARCSFSSGSPGRLPGDGVLRAAALGASRRKTKLTLEPFSPAQRQQRLKLAAEKLDQALAADGHPFDGVWRAQVAELLWLDAPRAAEALGEAAGSTEAASASPAAAEATRRQAARRARERLDEALRGWDAEAARSAAFVGRLDQLVEPLTYRVFVGDAWTDPGRVAMIPLPVIEPRFEVAPPEYARAAESDKRPPANARQLYVLEGSAAKVSLRSLNDKPLVEAWLTLKADNEVRRLPLAPTDAQRLEWRLPAAEPWLDEVRRELAFTFEALDGDGLRPRAPVTGSIRLKTDRAPTGAARLVSRVVLPSAKPILEYRVTDDYGVGALRLHQQIERRQTLAPDSERGADELSTRELIGAANRPSVLPHSGRHVLDLGSLNLKKGDQLRLTLEVVDYRGAAAGQSQRLDPVVLEISDESGVYAAILEADKESDLRLTDISNIQIGIGESP